MRNGEKKKKQKHEKTRGVLVLVLDLVNAKRVV